VRKIVSFWHWISVCHILKYALSVGSHLPGSFQTFGAAPTKTVILECMLQSSQFSFVNAPRQVLNLGCKNSEVLDLESGLVLILQGMAVYVKCVLQWELSCQRVVLGILYENVQTSIDKIVCSYASVILFLIFTLSSMSSCSIKSVWRRRPRIRRAFRRAFSSLVWYRVRHLSSADEPCWWRNSIVDVRPATKGCAAGQLHPLKFQNHVCLLGTTTSYNHFVSPRKYFAPPRLRC